MEGNGIKDYMEIMREQRLSSLENGMGEKILEGRQ